MKGAIGNAFILNMVIAFIIIFFMLLIGSVAYSKAYKVNKFLLDSLVDYIEYYNTVSYVKTNDAGIDETKFFNQKELCFEDCGDYDDNLKLKWSSIVNDYLAKSGYILSNESSSCPPSNDPNYIIKKNTSIGDYDYCIYQKEFYALDKDDDRFTKKRFSYRVLSYMKFDFPIIGEFIKIPIVSETKVINNFK